MVSWSSLIRVTITLAAGRYWQSVATSCLNTPAFADN
jgi:hypothetical protein